MADLVLESKSADSTKSSCTTTQLLITQDKLSNSVSYTLYLSLLQFRSVLRILPTRSLFSTIMKKGRKKNDHTNSKGISGTFSGVVVGSVGSVHFRIVP